MASTDHRLSDSLQSRRDALRQAEQRVLDVLRRPVQVAHDARAKHEARRISGKPGRSAGRWIFILTLLAVVAVWITLIAGRGPSGPGGHDAPEQARGAQ